jgi:hypothetical protein
METTSELQGGCLCRSIRYRISRGAPIAQSSCHCRSCRLAAGAPSVAWITVKRSDFALIADAARYRSSTPVVRTFCGKCGTPPDLPARPDMETIDVTTATLDQPDAFPADTRAVARGQACVGARERAASTFSQEHFRRLGDYLTIPAFIPGAGTTRSTTGVRARRRQDLVLEATGQKHTSVPATGSTSRVRSASDSKARRRRQPSLR